MFAILFINLRVVCQGAQHMYCLKAGCGWSFAVKVGLGEGSRVCLVYESYAEHIVCEFGSIVA